MGQNAPIGVPDDEVVNGAVHFLEHVLVAAKLIQNAEAIGQDSDTRSHLWGYLRVRLKHYEVNATLLQSECQCEPRNAATNDGNTKILGSHGAGWVSGGK